MYHRTTEVPSASAIGTSFCVDFAAGMLSPTAALFDYGILVVRSLTLDHNVKTWLFLACGKLPAETTTKLLGLRSVKHCLLSSPSNSNALQSDLPLMHALPLNMD